MTISSGKNEESKDIKLLDRTRIDSAVFYAEETGIYLKGNQVTRTTFNFTPAQKSWP